MTVEKFMVTVHIRYCKLCGRPPEFQYRIVDTEWGGPIIHFARCGNKYCENHLRVNVISALSTESIVDKWNEKYGDPEKEPREIMVEVEDDPARTL